MNIIGQTKLLSKINTSLFSDAFIAAIIPDAPPPITTTLLIASPPFSLSIIPNIFQSKKMPKHLFYISLVSLIPKAKPQGAVHL